MNNPREEENMQKSSTVEKEAAYGEKMIELKIRFFTNNIASSRGKVVPKHAWTCGVVGIEKNKVHEIVPQGVVHFQSLLDLGAAIEKILAKHGIKLHESKKMQKYMIA